MPSHLQMARMRRTFWKMTMGCLRKRKFMSKKVADRHAAKFDQRSYQCPYCGNWHLTKKKK